MWRYLRVFKVDLSLINHVRMIRCSYKNSQLNFRSEQRPKGQSRESMEIPGLNGTEKTKHIHNTHTIPTIQLSCGESTFSQGWNQITVGTFGEVTVLTNRLFSLCFHSSQKYLLLSCGPWKHPRGLCSIEQLLSTDHERDVSSGSAWIHHYTTQRDEQDGRLEEVGTVGVDSVGRAGSSYHTATMAASRNILLVHYGEICLACFASPIVGDVYCWSKWLPNRFCSRTGCQIDAVSTCSTFKRVQNEGLRMCAAHPA